MLSDLLSTAQGCPVEHSYKSLRKAAAGYIKSHEEHFKSFLSLESATFESYCRRIERTNAWGGQHELIALSHVLKRNIQVMRHDMSIQMFPDPETQTPYEGDPIRLSYHIHEYSGGEHYNSIVSLEEKNRRTRAPRGNRSEEEGLSSAQAGAASSESGALRSTDVAALKKLLPGRPKLTEEQRLKKMGKKAKLKGAMAPRKPPVPWEKGVGGDDWRVIVWDTRDGRLLLGNSCPTAKNIDRYLQEKPYMRIWKGGVDPEEPKAPVRPDDLGAQETQQPHANAAADSSANVGVSAPGEGSSKAVGELDDKTSNCSGPTSVDEDSHAGSGPAGHLHKSADCNDGAEAQSTEDAMQHGALATGHGLELHTVSPATAHQPTQSAELSANGKAQEGRVAEERVPERGAAAAAVTSQEAVLDGQHAGAGKDHDFEGRGGEKAEDGDVRQTEGQNGPSSDGSPANPLRSKNAPGSNPLEDDEESVAVYA